jgi:hypothetical protein
MMARALTVLVVNRCRYPNSAGYLMAITDLF